MLWNLRHWYMGATMERLPPARFLALRGRVLEEATTTFAGRFTRRIGLDQLLDRETMLAYTRQIHVYRRASPSLPGAAHGLKRSIVPSPPGCRPD